MIKNIDKYLVENREVNHTEVPGILGQWLFKNKQLKVFDMGSTYQIRRIKKLTSSDLYELSVSGLEKIEGAGGSSIIATLKK